MPATNLRCKTMLGNLHLQCYNSPLHSCHSIGGDYHHSGEGLGREERNDIGNGNDNENHEPFSGNIKDHHKSPMALFEN